MIYAIIYVIINYIYIIIYVTSHMFIYDSIINLHKINMDPDDKRCHDTGHLTL